jgi:hypothetical protein
MYSDYNNSHGTTSAAPTNPYIGLLFGLLFYIPCLLLQLLDLLIELPMNEFKKKTPKIAIVVFVLEIIVLLSIIVLCYSYTYVSKKYYYEGGLQILNEPISLNTQTELSNNDTLYGISPSDQKTSVRYNFSISTWFYIDSNNNSINDDLMILNYSYCPFMTYNPSSNILSVHLLDSEKYKECIEKINGPPSSEEKNACRISSSKIIYSNSNFKLQKWNHTVFVYTNGFLDIFLNNELVKSITLDIPVLEQSTIISGSNNGLNGGICNVLFFKESIEIHLFQM